MILKKIIKRTDSLLEKVPALYESAFPDDERIETDDDRELPIDDLLRYYGR